MVNVRDRDAKHQMMSMGEQDAHKSKMAQIEAGSGL